MLSVYDVQIKVIEFDRIPSGRIVCKLIGGVRFKN